MKAGMEDNLAALDFTKDGQSLFLSTSIGTDTARLVRHEIASGKETVIARSDAADLSDVMIQPTRHVVQAALFDPGRIHWTVIDPSVQGDFDAIAKVADGDFSVADRDLADQTWLVVPRATARRCTTLVGSRVEESDVSVQRATQTRRRAARADEADRVHHPRRNENQRLSHVTIGLAAKNLPMVLAVHGGPWGRDSWGFGPYSQLLANRGYAVLQMNFGSRPDSEKISARRRPRMGPDDAERPDRRRQVGGGCGNRGSETRRDLRRIVRRLRCARRRRIYARRLSMRDRRMRPVESVHAAGLDPPTGPLFARSSTPGLAIPTIPMIRSCLPRLHRYSPPTR